MQHTHNLYIIIIIVHVIAIYISNRFILFSFFFRLCQSKMALNFESISIIIIIRWWFNNNGKQPQKQTERKNRKWKKNHINNNKKKCWRKTNQMVATWMDFFFGSKMHLVRYFFLLFLSLSLFLLFSHSGWPMD